MKGGEVNIQLPPGYATVDIMRSFLQHTQFKVTSCGLKYFRL